MDPILRTIEGSRIRDEKRSRNTLPFSRQLSSATRGGISLEAGVCGSYHLMPPNLSGIVSTDMNLHDAT